MASLETNTSSQQQQQQLPFSIESFTYSWCINLNPPSIESLNNSLRFSLDHTLSDYFDINLIDLEPDALHRDYFHDRDGHPRVVMECSWGSSHSGSSSMLRRCKSFMSKKVLRRYLSLLLMMPICRRLIKGIQTKKLKKMSSKVDSCIDDPNFSHGGGNWRVSCDSETSIHEAVLHCKRSISN